jgi:hypothetical protein
MVASTNGEMQSYLTAHEELRCDGQNLYFPEAKAPSIRINLRVAEPHQLVYLARLVAHLGYEESHFSSAELWIITWGVWDPRTEAIAFKTLEQFRRSYGENRPPETSPGSCFKHDEFTESVCCLLQPMIVGWDAYYVPHWAYGKLDYFVFVSHDSLIDIHIRTQEMYEKALYILKGHRWIEGLLMAER